MATQIDSNRVLYWTIKPRRVILKLLEWKKTRFFFVVFFILFYWFGLNNKLLSLPFFTSLVNFISINFHTNPFDRRFGKHNLNIIKGEFLHSVQLTYQWYFIWCTINVSLRKSLASLMWLDFGRFYLVLNGSSVCYLSTNWTSGWWTTLVSCRSLKTTGEDLYYWKFMSTERSLPGIVL